ncbi:MAG: CDP-diacylglycerol--serine O-phosphatidyltransferase [Flavobacteriales bacterium]
MQLKKHIPNLFTLGNLLCGCLSVVAAFRWELQFATYLILFGAFLDFFDGFIARLLKVSGEIGKQLDSLADMVTFGVAPGMIVFQMLRVSQWGDGLKMDELYHPIAFIAFLIPLFSAYRLAKFNIDTRQSDRFIGLPTPANALFFSSFPLILEWNSAHYISYERSLSYVLSFPDHPLPFSPPTDQPFSFLLNPVLLTALTVLFSVLLISEIPLLALKFKQFGWKGNEWRWSLVIMAVALLIIFKFLAIPIIVVLYILISILNNTIKSHEIQS